MSEIKNRYDFVMLFDVKDGNPNGDPDAGNMPRMDPQTNHGLVSDVCIKRKLRNYVAAAKQGSTGYDIFIREKAILNDLIEAGYKTAGIDLAPIETEEASAPEDGKKKKPKKVAKPKGEGDEVAKVRDVMCKQYFDIRALGAVMSTGANAGQVRGPLQFTFSRSVDPIFFQEHSITRMAVTTQEDAEKQKGDNRTMGRKNTVPYGLYVGHGFVSPQFAKQTGFTSEDLELVWKGLMNMFEIDRSAARGLMSMRKVIVFKHASELGDAPAYRLFEGVKIVKKEGVKVPRAFEDYVVTLGAPVNGIEVSEL
jgi:CRISPR-associated protein Csd2